MLPSILMYAHPSSSCLPHQQYHLHKVTVTTVIRVFHLRHHHHYHLHKHDAYLMFPRMLMWVSLKLANPAPHSLVLARMEAWAKLASAMSSSPSSPSSSSSSWGSFKTYLYLYLAARLKIWKGNARGQWPLTHWSLFKNPFVNVKKWPQCQNRAQLQWQH